ncbi:MAG TPA: diaminobutyrate acetyltransferase [Gammaproteobacteria bacterium]|nr:diaminobutyrate acetyltransferase [Gammaproteobacteria bacterium]
MELRAPRAEDGRRIHALVESDDTLESNSAYCYVLLCTHFAQHGIVAEQNGELAGFVAAYRPPSDPEAVFVWQVGVAPAGRGQGLGKRLLNALIEQPANRDARYLTATVDAANEPSNRLFAAFARAQSATLETGTGFTSDLFPPGHAAEPLLRIGPLPDRD